MIADTSFNYLKANTVLFAQKMCRSLADMCGAEFTICKETLREGPFSTPYGIVLFANFTGAIQGNYIVTLGESVAAKLLGKGGENGSPEKPVAERKEYSGFLKEALNTAVGQAIEELDKSFHDLAYSPVTAVFGEIEFPDIMSASVDIEGREGKILCGFSINLASLKIGEKLEETLRELERRSKEAKEIQSTVESVLALLSSGFVTIDKKGVVLPGFSRLTPAIVGLSPEEDIAGTSLMDVIGVPDRMRPQWEIWLKEIFGGFDRASFNAITERSAPAECMNTRNCRLQFNWFPVTDTVGGGLVKLLVVIKDISGRYPLNNA